jgi:hypothetical protein
MALDHQFVRDEIGKPEPPMYLATWKEVKVQGARCSKVLCKGAGDGTSLFLVWRMT